MGRDTKSNPRNYSKTQKANHQEDREETIALAIISTPIPLSVRVLVFGFWQSVRWKTSQNLWKRSEIFMQKSTCKLFFKWLYLGQWKSQKEKTTKQKQKVH
jgi:hypothetical protein